jgi:hypothetical protein
VHHQAAVEGCGGTRQSCCRLLLNGLSTQVTLRLRKDLGIVRFEVPSYIGFEDIPVLHYGHVLTRWIVLPPGRGSKRPDPVFIHNLPLVCW